ncbi:twin-arginine translocase TatA/TatE family subunit [Streptomyces cyaneofuscatus]|uniref:twin-arginine translocase TatA/TatE family subunit n=1 Tax=Streptomyces cyaneofuscatus TaxID=66883 RepID=UPI003798BB74
MGSKKLPDTARALGKSVRILKSEAKAMKDDEARCPRLGVRGPAIRTGRSARDRFTAAAHFKACAIREP